MTRLRLPLLAAIAMTSAAAGRADMPEHRRAAALASRTASAPKAPHFVGLTISESGTEPTEVTAKKGEMLHLVVTRSTDRTCATRLVVPEYGIDVELPLHRTVLVDLMPKTTGRLRLLCGMAETLATLIVQ